MKQFIVDRETTPGTPALDPVAIPKVPVYDTLADAEADLANLAEGQMIATEDTGAELSHPVDVIEADNMHAVTSNAVAEKMKVEDISTQVTVNTSYCNYCKVMKYDKVIDVYASAKQISQSDSKVIVTGLPPLAVSKNDNSRVYYAYGTIIYGSTGAVSYARVEGSNGGAGSLIANLSTSSQGVIHITYITD